MQEKMKEMQEKLVAQETIITEMNRTIPDICHGRHGRRPCKFFLAGVKFLQI